MLWNKTASRTRWTIPQFALASAFLLASAVGCGAGKPNWEQVVPATGAVTFNGAPVEGALQVFTPQDKSVPAKVRPTATTESGGRFEIGTYDVADGIPQGDYDVTITWCPLVQHSEGASPGPNRLPVRYASAETSQLTVHINSEDTDLKTLALTP